MLTLLLSSRLIKHTKQLLEENEERLCIKVLQTLREMMTKDRGYGEKVCTFSNTVSSSSSPSGCIQDLPTHVKKHFLTSQNTVVLNDIMT